MLKQEKRESSLRIDRERRLALLRSLNLDYDPTLPIVQRREEIAGLIRENQVVVVCGETGSGKSTQLPKICLEIGRGISGTIGHTQPRRIAARSIATRLAEELTLPLGQAVGYKVRFDEKISPDSLVKLMTDGILLAESQSDKFFRQYDTIIIDEAHERSLNIDFLLGMMRRILPKRPELKLIITSATIDARRFAVHFSVPGINSVDNRSRPVPVIEVSGRTFPIDLRYRSLDDCDDEEENEGVSCETDVEERAILAAVDELARHERGDMLIFLPTERDILATAKALRHHQIPGDDAVSNKYGRKTEILPLYARLPVKEQQKVFKTNHWRRIVLATNVAESSLTVPGIRYVIDTGTARISRYSSRSRTQRLPIEAVSRASADQRAGRCGRIGPGICIRLFSEQDYKSRDRYTTPEIQRTNLASVILQTLALRLGEIEKFPFLDPPRISAISDGFRTLFEIGAIDDKRQVTPLGWKLSRLPVDPRIGRMILAAETNGVLHEMLIVAAAMEIQDPRERPQEHQGKADASHARFLDSRSDYVSYLKLWDFYQNLKDKTSRSGLRKACQQYFLSFNRMKEWSDIHLQLLRFVHDAGMRLNKRGEDGENFDRFYGALHRSILAGNLSGIAQRDNKFEYAACGLGGSSGGKFVLWPGSGMLKKKSEKFENSNLVLPSPLREREMSNGSSQKTEGLPRWIMAAERVETSRRYLRCVAQIDANWIEPLARHLVKRVYLEPHWNADTGYVHAFEKVSLLGIVIVPKRRINFGPIDPKQARDIFIQQALVEGQLDTQLDFFAYNEMVLEEAKSLQDKLRRPDILKPETARYRFYQERIPEDVYDKRTLEKWALNPLSPSKRAEMMGASGAGEYAPHHPNPLPEGEGNSYASSDASVLYMKLSDLCTEPISETVAEKFPDRLETFDGSSARIEYHFAPGEEHDGLTVIVPKEALRQLEPARLGWLVPGLVEQKIAALLKSLPKEIRRQIVPVPDTARDIFAKIAFGDGNLEERIAVEVSRLIGKLVTPKDFNAEQLPPELRMNIRVFDEESGTTTESRELDELRKNFGVKASETVAVADPKWSRMITIDHYGDLPESIDIERGGIKIKAFPMVLVDADHLKTALADSLSKAERKTRRAVVELFYHAHRRDIRTQVQWLPNVDKLKVYAQPLAAVDPNFDFQQAVGKLMAARALRIDEEKVPRTQTAFDRRINEARTRLGLAVQEVTKFIGPLLENFHLARLAIEQNKSARTEFAWRDAKEQLRRLVAPGFLYDVPWDVLKEWPRYFKGIPLRFEKLHGGSGGEATDRACTAELASLWGQYESRLELHQAAGISDPELETFRWMIEEYRISLFAQRLGTAMKVSPQRLEKQFAKVRS